tara:strand:+ start:555 stop:1310 length:756 start_codon:yes stop_codon:yes gene_type:complete
MSKINKLFERLSRFFRFLISDSYKLNNKYQNKNQITNAELILNLLKTKGFTPKYIIDVGCGYGQWTKKLFKFYPSSNYLLFDADKNNKKKLDILKKNNNMLDYKICLLSNDNKTYKFYNMGYGSSIFEEQTSHKREVEEIISTTLDEEIPPELKKYSNNLIKLDVQGAELKILDGLKDSINLFEVIILEVSLHNYNKNSPLFNDVIKYMNDKNFKLYDLFDLKRLGSNDSFLVQFDCVFARNNSELLNVKF